MGTIIGLIILFIILKLIIDWIGNIFKAIGAFFSATWHWWLIGAVAIILLAIVIIAIVRIRNRRRSIRRAKNSNAYSSGSPYEIVALPRIRPQSLPTQEEAIPTPTEVAFYEKLPKAVDYTFEEKAIMTPTEVAFYGKLQKAVTELFGKKMIIHPQIVLSSIINKIYTEKWKDYQSELNYVVDYVLVDSITQKVKLIIELNDNSHYRPDRAARDTKVESLCQSVSYSFVRFWLNDKNGKAYPNTIYYIKKRVLAYL